MKKQKSIRSFFKRETSLDVTNTHNPKDASIEVLTLPPCLMIQMVISKESKLMDGRKSTLLMCLQWK